MIGCMQARQENRDQQIGQTSVEKKGQRTEDKEQISFLARRQDHQNHERQRKIDSSTDDLA